MPAFKKIFLVLAFSSALGVSSNGSASTGSISGTSSVDEAFNSLMSGVSGSYSEPGSFSDGVRTVQTFGSARVRFQKTNLQLISITPPSFSAGCSGIDMSFGGFSYINGDQIGNLISSIMQNSSGLVIQQGIRLFCPICADVLATMQDLAQTAASMSIDSCSVAEKMVNSATNALGADGKTRSRTAKSMCSNDYSSSGASNDWFGAISSGCQSVQDSIGKLSSWVNSQPDKDSAATEHSDSLGNPTWMALTEMGFSSTLQKEFLMSAMGFSSRPYKAGLENYTVGTSGWGARTTDSESPVLVALLYGYAPSTFTSTNSELQAKYHDHAYIENYFYYICENSVPTQRTVLNTPKSLSGVMKMCDFPSRRLMKDLGTANLKTILTPHGLLQSVHSLMMGAIDNVSKNKTLTSDESKLVMMSPPVVYRMIKIAAVYPAAAKALVDQYAEFVAILIAQSLLNTWFSQIDTVDNHGLTRDGLIAAKKMIREMVNKLNLQTNINHDTRIKTQFTIQEGLMDQLNMIDRAVKSEAAHNGLLGNMAFAQMLSGQISAGR